jgi:outer membrane protein OmpA-like peptidoglycan-associated protein/opacity protein-like surface antigen
MALASTAIATPALAREGSWYLELDFGPMLLEDSDFDIGTLNNAATLDSKYGGDGGVALGYDFGAFRLETEASYRKADHDNYRTGTAIFSRPGGSSDALTFMVNGLLDFGPDDGMQGFVGGGVGVGRVSYDIGTFLDDTDSGFAWQALAGIRAPIANNWDVGVKYRFLNIDKVDLVNAAGSPVSSRWRSHSAMGSLIYNFGGEEAAPPPPPPPPPPPGPPPPPPPPEAVCNKGPYIVFFDWDRADITPEAATILDSAITAYGSCDRVPIMLAGYTDRSGSTKYNLGLSQRRNVSVRGYLTARGVPDGVIASQAFGESNPRVPTADGVRELQNRRVEITYGPGSGF